MFESQFFCAENIVITADVYDAIAAAQLILKNEYEFRNLSDSGLKTLVPYLYNTPLPSFTDVTSGKFFDELDGEDYGTIRYACANFDYALRLFYTFNEWFENNLPEHKQTVELEGKVAVYTGIMKFNGLGVDKNFRKWAKIKSTNIDGYLKFINTATNRIHADLMAMGTETGRFASRKPNLQNCPRKDNDPIGVRNFIQAAPGKVFLDFDFSQIELRIGAFFCRYEKMISTYKRGGDIHAETTSVIYGITSKQAADKDDKDYKERRTIAKNCNFGVFFGLFQKNIDLKFACKMLFNLYNITLESLHN